MRGPRAAGVGDMQSLRGGVTFQRAKSIVVNKLAVTFCPAGVGGSRFHASSQFLRTFSTVWEASFNTGAEWSTDMATVKLTLNNAPHSTQTGPNHANAPHTSLALAHLSQEVEV